MYVRSKFWTYNISGSVVLYWLQQKFSFVACHSRREYEYHWLIHFVGFLRIAFAMHDDSAGLRSCQYHIHVVVMHSGSEALWLCYRKWWVTVKYEIVRLNCSGIQESLRACASETKFGGQGLPRLVAGGGAKKKMELAAPPAPSPPPFLGAQTPKYWK